MHLHGHTFQVIKSDGILGPRKDTAIVLPKQAVSVTLIADNPGYLDDALPQHLSPSSRRDASLNYTT